MRDRSATARSDVLFMFVVELNTLKFNSKVLMNAVSSFLQEIALSHE